jgi:NAD(P)-dependent dehydrogenase (short-subunit alcohol dehydrogenase family)
VAIVTGGASGIGRSASILYAEHGAKVLVVDFNGDGASETAAMINAAGGVAEAMQADVGSESDNEAMVAHAIQKWGRLDTLFANAGVSGPLVMGGDFDSTTGEDFLSILRVNTVGAFLGAKFAQRVSRRRARELQINCKLRGRWQAMKKNDGDGGSIIITSSVAGLRSGHCILKPR